MSMSPVFSDERKRTEIEREKALFAGKTVGFVMLKTAPWSARPSGFGVIDIADIQADRFVVDAGRDERITYPSLDAVLEDWIGD